jgi:hypothetical protein
MKNLYLLLLVLFTTAFAAHSQDLPSNLPSFDDNIDDVGTTAVVSKTTTSKFSVYPNPTTGNVNINIASFKAERLAVLILNTNGRMVGYKRIENSKDHSVTSINVSNLPTGMYVIKVVNDTRPLATRLIVKA